MELLLEPCIFRGPACVEYVLFTLRSSKRVRFLSICGQQEAARKQQLIDMLDIEISEKMMQLSPNVNGEKISQSHHE